YNTFRYYDPESGRYLTPDPIGLAGGLHLYGYVPDPNGWMDPWGWCSKALGQNMEKAGIPRPKNTTPHHIAGDTGQAAQPGLAILKKHGIGVDDAANGVFLPNRGNTDLSTPGILHNGRHPNKYIEAVNKRLHKADVKGGKQAVLNELNAIRTELLNASRNAKWKDVL
uniref:RHS repeat-associated core domain-containing protein n=1 Tax=Chitinilyticum litopenaei TaxID=1121276 RepID=UPI0009DC16A9